MTAPASHGGESAALNPSEVGATPSALHSGSAGSEALTPAPHEVAAAFGHGPASVDDITAHIGRFSPDAFVNAIRKAGGNVDLANRLVAQHSPQEIAALAPRFPEISAAMHESFPRFHGNLDDAAQRAGMSKDFTEIQRKVSDADVRVAQARADAAAAAHKAGRDPNAAADLASLNTPEVHEHLVGTIAEGQKILGGGAKEFTTDIHGNLTPVGVPTPKSTLLGKVTGTVSPEVADALKMAKRPPADILGKFGKKFDEAQGLWKGWTLATPGKAIRHMYAGVFGLAMGDVTHTKDFVGLWRKSEGGTVLENLSAEDRRIFEHLRTQNIMGHRLYPELSVSGDSVARLGKSSAKLGDTGVVQGARRAARYIPDKNVAIQSKVLDQMRGAMFYDAMKKGLSPEAAASKVRALMFNASSLSTAERRTWGRLLPFYSFMRSQLTAEAEQMLREPAPFLHVAAMQRNLALGTVPDPNATGPGGAPTGGGSLTPFGGSNPLYAGPDLPFMKTDESLLTQPLDWKTWLRNSTPALTIPLEAATGYNSQTGNTPKATSRYNVTHTPILQQLEERFAKQSPGRGKTISPKTAYALRSIPALYQLAQVWPGDKYERQQRIANLLKYGLGLKATASTPEAQAIRAKKAGA